MRGNGSFIYVIENGRGQRKVGVSVEPIQRLAALQTGSPEPLRFAYVAVTPGRGYAIETRVKRALAAHRTSGEWFDLPLDVILRAIVQAANDVRENIQEIPSTSVPSILAVMRQSIQIVALPIYYRRPVAFFLLLTILMWLLFFIGIDALFGQHLAP